MQYNITYGALVNTVPVVTLAMAKQNSNIETDHEDELLQVMLDAAVEEAQNYLDTPVQSRNVVIQLTQWPSLFEFPLGPVKSVESITYRDANGVEQSLQAQDYLFYGTTTGAKLMFRWETKPVLEEDIEFPITINCVAGYAAAEMPAVIKKAVLLRFSFNERFREEMPTSANRTFHAALRPLKRWG